MHVKSCVFCWKGGRTVKDELIRSQIHQAVDHHSEHLQSNPFLAQRIINQERTGEPVVKKRLSIGLVLVIVLMLIAVTALAVALLSPKEIVEQVAVPMAKENDEGEVRQEYYSHEQLAQLIQTLGENGFTLDENTTIIQAFKSGQGYWEDEVLMEICREAFGSTFDAWSIEQKYWYETISAEIGLPGEHAYRLPDENDMTEQEAAKHAADLLKDACGVDLPGVSDSEWLICPYFYEEWDTEFDQRPAVWEFWFVNRQSGTPEYIVRFLRNGELYDMEEAGFHNAPETVDTFSTADRLMGDKYGSMVDWPMAAWSEFARMIAGITPERQSEWCYQHAGYRLPPEGSISSEAAIHIVDEAAQVDSRFDAFVICCTDGETPIYKVNLSYFKADFTDYAAFWCGEVDCMTGELRRLEEYHRGSSPALMRFVPFSVLENAPDFTASSDEHAREAVSLTRREAYERYEAQYQTMWYFWPLEAQKEALGPHHDIPQGNEMTRDQAAEAAIGAVRERYGQIALDRLGDWQTGVICCRYPEEEGVRVVWEIYITSDPVTISNGYRVTFDDPAGVMTNPEIEVFPANGGNG